MRTVLIKSLLVSVIYCFSISIGAYSIVFVHIGKQLPVYLPDALFQARLFNEQCDIYLIANQQALDAYHAHNALNVNMIPIETLRKTKAHKKFLKASIFNQKPGEQFWLYASERFLYLDDFMQQFNKEQVFHLESDNMLYVDLAELMPIFLQKYPAIAAVFDNDIRCVPGFIYISHRKVMHELAECFVKHARSGKNDMEVIGQFKEKYGIRSIDNLPIVTDAYKNRYTLKSTMGHTTKYPDNYSKHLRQFRSVFDGAALGQYLGGLDPIHRDSQPGFINESCLFNSSHFTYTWEVDAQGRKIPYMVLEGESYRINNLHVHSKNLKQFLSI